ncbi:DUF664 domain-containing protein [Actinomycetospora sp. NBRC 106378]|uniref:mycothiol transferase n=1 Tax=Actinomycetospora sp. NBRC 106378 TaxID=3032208 RepID=UPI0024A1A1D4|nr:DUF664 domain-containing protein [Actinomycetospora sp. NBRC 106378]GLZ51985.1 hypothetical protein Acsp07_16020 [Actinomycetospora sp. NBRC 106378]
MTTTGSELGTITALLDDHRERLVATLDGLTEEEGPDDGLDRGRTVRGIHLQVLRELAQHQGHADILREQVLAARPTT